MPTAWLGPQQAGPRGGGGGEKGEGEVGLRPERGRRGSVPLFFLFSFLLFQSHFQKDFEDN